MNAWALVLGGARYYWRTHLGVVLGAALGALVLTGALLVGDSVTATLRGQALARVGKADVAMASGDRFFRGQLDSTLGGLDAAPVMLLRASITRADGTARVNAAQLLGVDFRFWKLAPRDPTGLISVGNYPHKPKGGVGVNQRLAEELGLKAGDTIIIRVEKPGLFSRDAPLSGDEKDVVAIRVQVGEVLDSGYYGDFALTASQVPPLNAFVPLDLLQQKIAMAGGANLLLGKSSVGQETFSDAVAKDFSLADASLELVTLKTQGIELRSPRVFLEPAIVNAAPVAPNRVEALTYFVNELRAGDKATPYSMVTAVSGGATDSPAAELKDDEIAINQWLSDDLSIGVGGEVTIKYYVMGERRQLIEKSHQFKVAAVLPMDLPQVNGSWMPDFPGLSDKQNCRDWKPGFDFDSTKIRDKDQTYWEKYRGTPKAFVNLKIGQELWGNRWGNVTSIRWPAGTNKADIEYGLLAKLTPEMLGFQFIPLREQALKATNAPVDFGQLFVSFSFFLIIAAAVLTGMLFVFSLEQRNAEAGLLLALGLRPKQVRRLFLAEGAVLALVGSVLGAFGGIAYTKIVLWALSSVWKGAVGAVDFQFAMPPETLATGVVSGVVVALLAMWLASRRQLHHSARELLAGEVGETARRGRRPFVPFVSAAIALMGAVALLATVKGAEAFFSAGALLLIAGLSFALGWLRRLANAATGGLESIAELGARNTTRRRGRSLATIAVLASGVFMVVAVDSFRHPPVRDGDTSDPGTGGFALVGESSLPIYEDLNTAKGRDAYGLSDEVMRDVKVVPLRVRDGDDASCLNLNRALQPRLLGSSRANSRSATPSALRMRRATGIS